MGGFAGSKILEQHGERMLQRNFEPGAPARIQLKDLRMILDEARAEGLSLPLTQRVFEEYRALLASGHGEVDHSGLLLELERLNGVRLVEPAAAIPDALFRCQPEHAVYRAAVSGRQAAAEAGFGGVEYLFPYPWDIAELQARLADHGLSQVLFNLPPGDWSRVSEASPACPIGWRSFVKGFFRRWSMPAD